MITYNEFLAAITSASTLNKDEVWEYDGNHYYGNVYRVLLKLNDEFIIELKDVFLERLFEESLKNFAKDYMPNVEEIIDDVVAELKTVVLNQVEIK